MSWILKDGGDSKPLNLHFSVGLFQLLFFFLKPNFNWLEQIKEEKDLLAHLGKSSKSS